MKTEEENIYCMAEDIFCWRLLPRNKHRRKETCTYEHRETCYMRIPEEKPLLLQ